MYNNDVDPYDTTRPGSVREAIKNAYAEHRDVPEREAPSVNDRMPVRDAAERNAGTDHAIQEQQSIIDNKRRFDADVRTFGHDRAKELAERRARDAAADKAGKARGVDARGRYHEDPVSHLSTRDAILAAIEEEKTKKPLIKGYDHVTGQFQATHKQERPDLDPLPPGWEGVHIEEFAGVPYEQRQISHKKAREVVEFIDARNGLANPQTTDRYLTAIGQRFPLSDAQKLEGLRWMRDPNRQPVKRPVYNRPIPEGWTQARWDMASPAVRQAAWKTDELAFTKETMEVLMASPHTRLQGYKILHSEFPQVERVLQGYVAPLAPIIDMERSITDWSKGKTHLHSHIPNGSGGTMPVWEAAGRVVQHDAQLAQAGHPQQFNTVVPGNYQASLERAYALVTQAAGLQERHSNYQQRQQRRTSTSMRGGAPAPPPPPGPPELPRMSIREAATAAYRGEVR